MKLSAASSGVSVRFIFIKRRKRRGIIPIEIKIIAALERIYTIIEIMKILKNPLIFLGE
jgi:hypothetical protein